MMERKLAIITGADGGMGMEITRAVAREGYAVIMACCSLSKAEPKCRELAKETGNKNMEVWEIAPIGIWHLKKKAGVENDMPNEIERPYIAQTLAFDVIYDVEEAKRELTYLFGVIDMFNMSDAEKKKFLEEIMQYWILSVRYLYHE